MNREIGIYRNLSDSFLKWTVAAVLMAISVLLCCTNPIAQDPSYHSFADHRTIAGIDNCWNVVTNLGFLVVGIWGLCRMLSTPSLRIVPEIKLTYIVLFTGISLVAFGSAFYHLHPNNVTLVWDRLPMTIVFMALLAICIAECASANWARSVFLPLLVAGQGSVFYWYFTELHGKGDLRPYILVQFVPVIILPILLLLRKGRFTCQRGYWILFCCYIVGKLAEGYDHKIYQLSGHLIAGHALKHIFILVGLFALARCYEHRKFRIG